MGIVSNVGNLFVVEDSEMWGSYATKYFSFIRKGKVMGGCWRAQNLLEGSVLELRAAQLNSVYLQMVRRKKTRSALGAYPEFGRIRMDEGTMLNAVWASVDPREEHKVLV